VADFPTYFSTLTQRKALPAAVAREEPWTAELAAAYLEPLGIASMLDAGIFDGGHLIGVVCHEHVGAPRPWSIEERDFAGSIADRLAVRIQAGQVQELRRAFQTHERRQAAQQKAAAVEEVAAGIAHDLKNLLTTFQTYGMLLSNRSDLPRDAREQAQEILIASRRGAALANELMEFGRPTFSPPAVLDLGEATRAMALELQAAAGADCELHVASSAFLGRVLMEKSRFRRLLFNVVLNASEAMPEGGAIKIRVVPVRRRDQRRDEGRYVMVEVADAGVGMDEATLERLFEPYFTTKAKGTGLGMPIVQQIMDRVGGFVRVESQPGRGTTVRMFFPAICAAAKTAAAANEVAQ
jgi:signal transduction histidine kinase